MVFPHRTSILIYLVILALVFGCSGGGGQTPTAPGAGDSQFTANVDHSAAGNSYIWESGEVILDTEELEATVVPLRTAEFTLNIVKFMQPPAGSLANLQVAFDLPNCDIPNAYVDVDTTISHPFPGTDYWGFDVRVIIIGGGSTTGKNDTTVRYATPSELRLVNADGYTRWWNRDEFGPFEKIFGYTEGALAPKNFTLNFATVNGYKYFAPGIPATQVPPNPTDVSRGNFASGSVTRQMLLQFPQGTPKPFKFKYSISASWDTPTTSPPTNVSQFPATANQQEAYQIVVTQDPASTAYYDNDDQTFGGDLILSIEIWDWQADGNAADEISAIWLESPTLLSNQGDKVEIKASWTESAGSSPNSIIYSGTLSSVTPTSQEDQELFITVVSADPTTYEPPLSGFLYPSQPLAAYQLFGAGILPSGEPIPSIIVTDPNGGETAIIGSTYEIKWTSYMITDVVIEYSTDGGTTYPNVIVPTTPSDGSYIWDPVPDTPTTTAKVRITDAAASPLAQDESNNNFTIAATGEQGWNPVPGKTQMPADNPAPNQSTVSPDLGIQNDDAGGEGAWMVDQEGGVADGSPLFYNYLLDWSGPGGNAYPSGFNFNFAPFNRHDVSSNGIVIAGCSANPMQMDPPVVNDPLTAIWYISYLKDDETAVAGDLLTVMWGDQGEGDPPGDDPDAVPWFHTCDVSGGLPGWQGDDQQDSLTWLMCYSHEAGAPVPDTPGDLQIGFWQYPFLTGGIYRLPFPEYTTDLDPPLFLAFDVNDPGKCRMAADTDSYLTFSSDLDGLAVMTYMLDSLGNFYGSGYQVDWAGSQFYYIGLGNSLKIRTTDELYVEGATAVDLEMLPTVTYLYEQDTEQGWNWCAVLYDTGGQYVVRIYEVNWTAETGSELTTIDTTDPIDGTPLALDVDGYNFTIHVLADNGGTIEATVFNYTP